MSACCGQIMWIRTTSCWKKLILVHTIIGAWESLDSEPELTIIQILLSWVLVKIEM